MPELRGIILHAGARGRISLYLELISGAIPPSSACFPVLNGDPNWVFGRIVHFGGKSTECLYASAA